MMEYTYFKSCTDFTESAEISLLTKMIEDATDITLRTLKLHCVNVDGWAKSRGYEWDRRLGLVLAEDPCVSFHRSVYGGLRCYFIRWSGIESIWRPER